MSFSDEQKATIAEIVTNSLKAAGEKAATEAAEKAATDKAKAAEEAAKNNKTLAQQAKEQLESEKANEITLAQNTEAVKFNLGIKDFVEKNKTLLPDESGKILLNIAAKSFKDANEQANITRKGLIDSFLSQKENINSLTVSMADRAKEYDNLAESEKEKRSAEFWDLVETGVALKLGMKKAEALNKVNGVTVGESSKNKLEGKFLAAAKKKYINNFKE